MEERLVFFVVGPALIALAWLLMRAINPPTRWPSPPRLPFLGSIPVMSPDRFLEQCLDWRAWYGPIIGLKTGTAPEGLLVTGAEMAKHIIVKDEVSFAARDAPWFYVNELRLHSYFTPVHPTSPHVLAQRSLIVKAVRSAIMQGKGNCVDRGSRAFLTDLTKLPQQGRTDARHLRRLLLDASSIVAINVGFGMHWSSEEVRTRPEARAIVEATDRIFELLNFTQEPTLAFPFLTWLLPARTKRVRQAATDATELLFGSHRALYGIAKEIVRTGGEDALDPSVVKTLLSEKGASMSEFQHMCLAGTTVAAASNSTASVLHAGLGALAAHPAWQRAMQTEVDSIMLSQDVNDRLPGADLLLERRLPVVEASATEIVRMYPAFPLCEFISERPVIERQFTLSPVSRVATQDTALPDGRKIPRGQKLFMSYHAINRDVSLFDGPEAFNPGRYLKNPDGSSATPWSKHKHASFGGGRRVCPGADLANNLLALFLARIVYCFDIRFVDPSQTFSAVKSNLVGVELHATFPDVMFVPRRDVSALLASSE